MEIDFKDINYLQKGNPKQQKAYEVLTRLEIFSLLAAFNPILVGTIPITIDIDSSDLDIICFFSSQTEFHDVIKMHFAHHHKFSIKSKGSRVVANFHVDGFEIEIFGQNVPTHQQLAYRHMLIEHELLLKYGEAFRQQILELKRKGHKTEPAFAKALNLTGDPYIELLKFEQDEQH
ncbi:MAG: DUF4269 domain-containing protein [Flavobacteriales bacterium]|nr:DUF4269 domain-containing protein [Flavobacteriales bacterium]